MCYRACYRFQVRNRCWRVVRGMNISNHGLLRSRGGGKRETALPVYICLDFPPISNAFGPCPSTWNISRSSYQRVTLATMILFGVWLEVCTGLLCSVASLLSSTIRARLPASIRPVKMQHQVPVNVVCPCVSHAGRQLFCLYMAQLGPK